MGREGKIKSKVRGMIEARKQERKKMVTDETGRDEKAIYGRIEVK